MQKLLPVTVLPPIYIFMPLPSDFQRKMNVCWEGWDANHLPLRPVRWHCLSMMLQLLNYGEWLTSSDARWKKPNSCQCKNSLPASSAELQHCQWKYHLFNTTRGSWARNVLAQQSNAVDVMRLHRCQVTSGTVERPQVELTYHKCCKMIDPVNPVHQREYVCRPTWNTKSAENEL